MQRKKVAVEIACGQHVNSAASPEDLHKIFGAGAKLGRS